MISLADAQDLVPELDTGNTGNTSNTSSTAPGSLPGADRFVAACYNPTDAIVFPWPFLWGYARAAERRGVKIQTGLPVTENPATGRRLRADDTGGGAHRRARRLRGRRLVAPPGAAGRRRAPRPPRAPRDPLDRATQPFLKPMVSVIESGLYVSQSLRGELVGGVSMPEEPNPDGEVRLGSRLDFLTTMARGSSRSCRGSDT